MRSIARVSSALLVATLLATTAASANPAVPTCQERVQACEDALDLADRAINQQSDAIQLLDAQNARLQKALDVSLAEQAKAESAATAWYKQPELYVPLTFIVGFVAGAYAVSGRR